MSDNESFNSKNYHIRPQKKIYFFILIVFTKVSLIFLTNDVVGYTFRPISFVNIKWTLGKFNYASYEIVTIRTPADGDENWEWWAEMKIIEASINGFANHYRW